MLSKHCSSVRSLNRFTSFWLNSLLKFLRWGRFDSSRVTSLVRLKFLQGPCNDLLVPRLIWFRIKLIRLAGGSHWSHQDSQSQFFFKDFHVKIIVDRYQVVKPSLPTPCRLCRPTYPLSPSLTLSHPPSSHILLPDTSTFWSLSNFFNPSSSASF